MVFSQTRPAPLRPDRLRTLAAPFGWIPFRIVKEGWLPRLSRDAKLLYFFLCLVADNHGVSFYGDARIARELGLHTDEIVQARNELTAIDLLAFNGRVYQVMSLPQSLRGHTDDKDLENNSRRGSDYESLGQILAALQRQE